MNSWDIYETRLLIPGREQRDRSIGREIEAVRRKYMASPSLKTVMVETAAREQYLLVHTTDIPSEKTFNTLPGETMSIGDIILWNNFHWLVTQIDFDDEITRSGRMIQCNRQIRWQNKKTGDIIERWCLATKPYTSNISEGLAIATSNREFKIQLTYDSESMLVDLDRRFLLEIIDGTPKAYQVTSVDTVTNRYQEADGGFLVWNLKQCEYNSVTDNAELMLADYFDAPELIVSPDLLTCEIDGKDNIRCGRSRTYRPVFYTRNNEVTDAVVPVWTMTCDNPLVVGSVTDVDYVLTVADDDSADGSVVQLTLQDADNLYAPTTMKVEVSALL